MPKRFIIAAFGLFLSVAAAGSAHAQDETRDEFWPELDAYIGLSDQSRLMLLASETRNGEVDLREGTLGIHVDFFAKPFARPWLRHHPDVVKQRYLTFRAGYRYSWDIRDGADGYEEHRWLAEGTGRLPPWGRFTLINRSRFEHRDVNDKSSWRYRNRTRVEGEISISARTMTPYLMAEFYYDSRYDDWNKQRYYAGVDWPIFTKGVLDTYYCRQNDSRSSIAHVNALGVTLSWHF